MKILVTGATGLLGGRLVPYIASQGYDVISHGMTKGADYKADLCSIEETNIMLDEIKPELIIHLACLSNVDACEQDKNLAYRLNVLTTENVVKWIENNPGTRLVYISTDHVYDGDSVHKEEEVTIRNTYAFSKYCAEVAASRINSISLRVDFFGKSMTAGRSSFTDWIINALQQKNKITLLTDVYINPLSFETIQKMILMAGLSRVTGIFNLGSRGKISKRDMAHMVAGRFGLDTKCASDGVYADLNFNTPRPANMVMDVSRFEETFKVDLPNIEQEIMSAELI